jgi:hypothetical protein
MTAKEHKICFRFKADGALLFGLRPRPWFFGIPNSDAPVTSEVCQSELNENRPYGREQT